MLFAALSQRPWGRVLTLIACLAPLVGPVPDARAQGAGGPIPLTGSAASPADGPAHGPAHGPAYGQEFSPPRASADGLPEREVGAAPAPRAVMPSDEAPLPSSLAPTSSGTSGREAASGGETRGSSTLSDARALIGAAQATIERLAAETGFGPTVHDLLNRSRAVMIVPDFYKAGFLLGAAYGNGVLMARQPDGSLSDPAFYRLTAGSLGFQAGLQSSEVVMVIMTDAGLRAIMDDRFKGGATASATFFLVGAGADASTTTNMGRDIYAFSRSVGLFGGAGLEGTAIEPRPVWNEAVYGGGATPDAIVLQGVATSPLTTSLRQAVPGYRPRSR